MNRTMELSRRVQVLVHLLVFCTLFCTLRLRSWLRQLDVLVKRSGVGFAVRYGCKTVAMDVLKSLPQSSAPLID